MFDFIRDDSFIRILPPRSSIKNYIKLIEELPEEDMHLGAIVVRCGSLTQPELDEALAQQNKLTQEDISQPIGSIIVKNQMANQTVVDAAMQKQTQVREGKVREVQSVRVDAEKLDHLINLIGELVIAGAGTSINALASGNNVLIESVSTLTRLVEEVRDSTLRLRMVQIGTTFTRFQRVVRDVSKELGKEINLVITGAETELDKTVVEKIGDPLMHLVRNSIDHGIESPEARRNAGKPSIGTLHLNAYHDSGGIVIEVSDDGNGLNRDRILSKAIEKGLISADQQLEDKEIYNLIFEPGFSTAETVSNLSGRGVGMDVVRRNITELRGTIDIDSKPGLGTFTRIRMPLTLAIIDGFLVGVDDSSFVVPLDMVLECVELSEESYGKSADRNYINLRGEVLPFIRLRDMFDMGGQPPRRENIVVLHYAGTKAGLVVDKLLGEFQTVIKPLGKIFSQVISVGGSTILGNGEVALILDVPGLIRQASSIENKITSEVT
ncbi:MAG: chemotaxis protein CheA [Oleibacter sp.]|nr:chemotaxis protein CheA [Thalassolituus sp.]